MGKDVGVIWEQGWAGHEQHQLERLARLPLADTLRWLEEAHHLVQRLQSKRPGTTTPELPPAASDVIELR